MDEHDLLLGPHRNGAGAGGAADRRFGASRVGAQEPFRDAGRIYPDRACRFGACLGAAAAAELGVLQAVWVGADRTACLTVDQGGNLPVGWSGACWPFVTHNFGQFMFGRYPVDGALAGRS